MTNLYTDSKNFLQITTSNVMHNWQQCSTYIFTYAPW